MRRFLRLSQEILVRSCSWACWKKSEDPTSKSSDILSDVFGAHFTYKSQRARANQQPTAAAEYHALEAPRSERARFAVAAAAVAAASPASSSPSSVLLIACKGKNNPSLLSHSIRSEICIWEGRRRRREKVLPLPLPPLPRHRACICPSSIYGDSCHCGGRGRTKKKKRVLIRLGKLRKYASRRNSVADECRS